ncbi:MAG: Gldg family protein [Planctomycetales bacterium]|nr:Gldg family protein [Planctomycetales bacterium]
MSVMQGMTFPLILLMCIDAAFFLAAFGLLIAVCRGQAAGFAVLKRNFVGYFSNPTGYLFILLFVSLCSACAFYPNDFFNDNLATLHQLNLKFPWIMLIYIPTITMGMWSEERRQGTDELLLTVPASDWDIVLGKYLAAVSIYSVSLVFSQIANFMVLAFLSRGEVDLGLFATTYLGYWLVGIAMIAIGMVGSFLTPNITIGFILGLLFNLPLVLASFANVVLGPNLALAISRFSYAEQLFDFGRGVITLRSLVFFALVVVLGLYLSMVLVGKRHWSGGRDGRGLAGHFLLRVLSLMVLTLAITTFFLNHDVFHLDGTSQQVNSLSTSTKNQISQLTAGLAESDKTVIVEAYISQQIPEDYARTKLDLISKLREFDAIGGNRVEVRLFDNLERFSDAAVNADEKYGIRPNRVMVRDRGAIAEDEIIMGAAFTCGLEKVVVPFFDQGIPVEYELLRSICTVAEQKRKRLGVVNTDARLFGGFDMQRMEQTPKQLIVEELEKQYEVIQLDPNNAMEQDVDVMLVVQPSSLTQPQMDNLVAAVRKGTPTAIFEDPLPVMMAAPGTSQPKPPQGGMMGMGQPPEPKGNIQELWDVLGIRMAGNSAAASPFGPPTVTTSVVWQNYNPYQKLRRIRDITMEWVFASPSAPGGADSLNSNDEIVSGLQQILMLYPGAIENEKKPGISFTPIVSTGDLAGTIPYQDLTMGIDSRALDRKRVPSATPLVLAARIKTEGPAKTPESPPKTSSVDDRFTTRFVQAAVPPAPGGAGLPGLPPAQGLPGNAPAEPDKVDVIYVSDIDLMHSQFLRVRAQPNMSEVQWKFDNVTFVLNVIDELAGDERFLEVRKKQPRHSTLKLVEQATADARLEAEQEMNRFNEQFEEAEAAAKENQQKAIADLQSQIDELNRKATESGAEPSGREIQRALQAALQQMMLKEQVEQRRVDTTVQTLTRERDRNLQKIELQLDKQVQQMKNSYKLMALLLPMLPPILIGLAVFVRRRSLESEGISAARRR